MTATDQPPAGWYDDPADERRHRYWDGARWTAGVAVDGRVSEDPLDPAGAEEAWDERLDHRAPWPSWMAGFALAAVVAGVGAAHGAMVLTAGARDGVQLLAASTALYGVLFAACWSAWRWHGRDAFGRDFGLAYRSGDWWRGLLGSAAARLAAILAALVSIPFVTDLEDLAVAEGIDEDGVTLLVFAVTALVVAPILEELFFRGLLLRALETALPVWLAIAVQAALFGLAHATTGAGAAGFTIVAAVAGAGVVFGWLARRYHRLGPAVVAHAAFNVLPVLLVVLAAAGA